ncbi:type II 3-dehydroquinate dehydratase [Acidiferrobacter sp.]|uniref:type II 3-dehydroquinate dehydratase n=1 Tax=Acidiferrobacter sp. TaxID=1872107 RepID=UPI00263A2496|nr:type II 3-dehydroquinate dehydratase [Acidiferrobacter sp.]
MADLLVLNGPNLNLLGTREPLHYGTDTLAVIETRLAALAADIGHSIAFLQSNAEHELIARVHEAATDGTRAIIINPAGLTHTSVALRDALGAVGLPFIEVHLSNTYAREPFRRHSYFSDIAAGTISGLGALGYELALMAAATYLQPR